jgi:hypothetical protein
VTRKEIQRLTDKFLSGELNRDSIIPSFKELIQGELIYRYLKSMGYKNTKFIYRWENLYRRNEIDINKLIEISRQNGS